MAWLSENSQLNFGKYKGKKVKDVNDKEYIKWLHESRYNIYFDTTVLTRLNIKPNKNK